MLKSTFLVPLRPPVPWYAGYTPIPPQWHIYFDRPLQPGTLDPANFDITHLNQDRVITSATAIGNRVDLRSNPAMPFTPPNGISYHATPPEIFNLDGLPAAPFVKLPFI